MVIRKVQERKKTAITATIAIAAITAITAIIAINRIKIELYRSLYSHNSILLYCSHAQVKGLCQCQQCHSLLVQILLFLLILSAASIQYLVSVLLKNKQICSKQTIRILPFGIDTCKHNRSFRENSGNRNKSQIINPKKTMHIQKVLLLRQSAFFFLISSFHKKHQFSYLYM